MTIRYNLFGIPGTVNEFLDREEEKYGSREVNIQVDRELRRSKGAIFPDNFQTGIYLCSRDYSRRIQVKKYRGHHGPVEDEIPEISRRIDEDKSELISKIEGRGFVIFHNDPLASPKKKEQSEASSSPHNQPEIERQRQPFINPWDIDIPKIEDQKMRRQY